MNNNSNSAFNLVKEIADKAEYYNALSTVNKYTIACILFDAGYNSLYAKRINPDYPKWQQWDCCREAAINICRYCQAVSSFMAVEVYDTLDSKYGRTTEYKYAVQVDGTLIDNEYSEVIYCPEGALRAIIDSANLLNEAFCEAYNTSTEWTDGDKILRLAQFTNGIGKVIQRASGRKKAAKAMALYREAIRYRNAHWAIKHGG